MTIKTKCSWIVVASLLLAGCYPKTDLFLGRVITGNLQFPEATEVSGVVASRSHPGVLWVHNDSGDIARVFALDKKGNHLGEFRLEGVHADDWEDIAIGIDPVTGEENLYIGDIGDNDAVRTSLTVHKIIDPLASAINGVVPASAITSSTFTYSDQPRDAEALFLDPWDEELYILSKRESRQVLYRVPSDVPIDETGIAELVMVLPAPEFGKIRDNIVAADISPDGSEILVKTYFQILYWKREDGQNLASALKQEPMRTAYAIEKQGEAVAWAPEGLGYFSIPEGNNPIISYYGKK